MAKKKKKLTKYNQLIRIYFDGDGFDEGITRVPQDKLIELAQSIGLAYQGMTPETLVRSFRRIWSEADVEPRQHIVNYFKDLGQIFSGNGERHQSADKVEKIDSFLDQLDLSSEEANSLHAHFMHERTKRISLPKIEKALYQMRLARKLKVLEKSLEVSFTDENALEFFAPVSFVYAGENFSKILQIRSEPLSYTILEESDIDDLRPYLTQIKQKSIQLKQEEANAFLANLPHPHPYMLDEEILQALKTMPPENIFTYTPLSEKTLRAVFARNFKAHSLQLMDYNLIMHKESVFTYEGHELAYDALSEISLNDLLPRLWKGEPIDFDDEFSLHTKMIENAFQEELNELIQAGEESASILDMSHEEVSSFIMNELKGYISHDLHIPSKTARKILFSFNKSIEGLKLKKQREALLARTIRDFKNLFPVARELRRKLIFHVGPTNSGKTYQAMKALEKADTGYYLAPLRLLALEGYERLKADGVSASLITGEEQILDEYATHISSTIEDRKSVV